MTKTLSVTLIGLVAIGVATIALINANSAPRGSQNQNRVLAAPAILTPHSPVDEGAAKGTAVQFQLNAEGLRESVLNQPVPEVWLEKILDDKGASPSISNATRIELPQESRKLLLSCWKAYLEYFFNTKVEEKKEFQELVSEDRKIVATVAKIADDLQELSIDAPSGRRNISNHEAWSIVSFLGSSAKSIVEQAKPYKQ